MRKLTKAMALEVDEVVSVFEDVVAFAAKESARTTAVSVLGDWRGPAVAVRVNAPRSRCCHLDVHALGSLTRVPTSIVLPKVESAGDIAFGDCLRDGVEAGSGRAQPLRVQALFESAAGLAAVQEIAGASDRLEAPIRGYAELSTSLGGARLDAWLPAQHEALAAARANGLQASDGPFLGVAADEPFLEAAGCAREVGFDGKWAIHPVQVESLNELSSPGEVEMERARAVIEALAQAESGGGDGAAMLDVQMLDEAARVAALSVLARGDSDATRSRTAS